VDVTHHRHDGRPRPECRLRVVGGLFPFADDVFLFAHRLEPERGRDQLDHIEVEPLVDRHHLPQLFEGESDDLLGWHLEDVGELGDRDELGYADQGLFALLLLTTLLLLDVAEARPLVAAVHALARDRAFDRRERARDVLRHGLLVHQRLLTLLALLSLVAPALLQRPDAGGGGRDGPGGRGDSAAWACASASAAATSAAVRRRRLGRASGAAATGSAAAFTTRRRLGGAGASFSLRFSRSQRARISATCSGLSGDR